MFPLYVFFARFLWLVEQSVVFVIVEIVRLERATKISAEMEKVGAESHLAPHTSHLTPHTSHLTRHTASRTVAFLVRRAAAVHPAAPLTSLQPTVTAAHGSGRRR